MESDKDYVIAKSVLNYPARVRGNGKQLYITVPKEYADTYDIVRNDEVLIEILMDGTLRLVFPKVLERVE